MSRGKTSARRRKREANIASLKSLFRGYGLGISQYSVSHLRIFGKVTVDYWPSTERAWITGSSEKTMIMAPLQVCELAAGLLEFKSHADLLNAQMDAEFRNILK